MALAKRDDKAKINLNQQCPAAASNFLLCLIPAFSGYFRFSN
jgi:hypothetical protein